MAVEQDLTAGRDQELGQQVEDGCLARTVGTDQGMNLAALHAQIDTVDRNKALELFDELSSLKNEIAH